MPPTEKGRRKTLSGNSNERRNANDGAPSHLELDVRLTEFGWGHGKKAAYSLGDNDFDCDFKKF
uniref:Uncharacterized protein n=1 Tax=Utricularia reniformis TaxID=192314 RepID=A0A1Y0AZ18_9LAMI|nr:hypothetical protein AEK19_MT1735 [Utricularia reniformis]ART30403.1 hypothetical protein AEK19_MT1735 [Utricularia reniformis]